jgi:peptidoglycan/xylan/chitin deacetylase (PgdA/CDA1 family)
MTFLNSVVAPALFPSILWRTTEQSIHITFDDGPHPAATPTVLKILSARGIRATFFLVGRNVQRYPEVTREIILGGHSLGNHTQTHQVMFLKPAEVQRGEIQAANGVIGEFLSSKPRFFRPPYGYFDLRTLNIAKTEGQRVVMWDVDSHDFSTARPEFIVHSVTKRVTPGSIVLFHDNASTADSIGSYLELVLDQLLHRGFQFSVLPL